MYIYFITFRLRICTMAFHSSVDLLPFLWTVALFVFGLYQPALTQAATLKDEITLEEIQKLELFAGDVMSCAYIPGLAIGVIRGNATFSTGLGLADMHTGHPVSRTTTFNLGSTAKAFVPYILAQIFDSHYNMDKRYSFDSTLGDFQGILGDVDVPENWRELTLKDMLLYESKGSSAADLATMAGLPRNVTKDELIRRLDFLPKTEEFRSSSHYSNYMYTIAGHLAERLTSKTWKMLVQEFVLDKHDMDLTTFSPYGMTLDDVALPYRYQASNMDDPWLSQNSSLFDIRPSEPSGFVMAPSVDVSKWMRDLLHLSFDRGVDSGNSFRSLFNEWVTIPENHSKSEHLHHDSQTSFGYGMGWESSSYRGFQRYKYSGHLYAYSSQIWLFPDVLSAVFISVNGPNTEQAERAIDGIMFHASDLILRQEAWVSSDIACCCEEDDSYDDYHEETAPEMQIAVKYLIPKEKYEGVYGNALVGNVKVQTNVAGILEMRLGRNIFGELLPSESDNKLNFRAKLPLTNTRDWESEKIIEFLPNHLGELTVLKLQSQNIFYDFERGKTFETIPYLPDVKTTLPTTIATTQEIESTSQEEEETIGTENSVTENTFRHPSTTDFAMPDKNEEVTNETGPDSKPSPDDNDTTYVDTQPEVEDTVKESFQRDGDERTPDDSYKLENNPKLANSAQRGKDDLSVEGSYAQVDEATTECFLNAANTFHVSLVTVYSLLVCMFLHLTCGR